MKTNKEIVEELHIKWLSKADTAKIRDSESTVILYGYLGQAVKEALEIKDTQLQQLVLNLHRHSPHSL